MPANPPPHPHRYPDPRRKPTLAAQKSRHQPITPRRQRKPTLNGTKRWIRAKGSARPRQFVADAFGQVNVGANGHLSEGAPARFTR